MMIAENLIIFYHPGARGDFLASVLLNQLANQTAWQITTNLISHSNINYIKAHNFTTEPGEFGKVQVEDLLLNKCIRIKLDTISDFLTAVYYSKSKIQLNETPSADSLLFDYLLREKRYRKFDNLFNHVVNFSDLFDIKFLKQFYTTVMKAELSNENLDNIQKNIDINPILNLTNHQNYLNIDIESFIHNYEQTFRVSISQET